MEKFTRFIFAIHGHQPIGNFDFVFDNSYKRCYEPFIKSLFEFPQFKCCLHYSGILLEWIRIHYPDHIGMIRTMVSRGQLEMLSGGYYEPILAIIPDEDKIGQIKKLSQLVKKLTGTQPQGMWLAERVWEPHLPSSLSDAGMKYVIVDDTHFKYAGLDDSELDGYYIAEEIGKMLKVFPSSKYLRYSIPFKDVAETIDFLKGFCDQSAYPVIVYADDAEKFGMWPGTFELCYNQAWLSNFFESMLKCYDFIRTVHFADVLREIASKGNVYLPTASYAEMMEWALPARATVELQDFEKKLKTDGLSEKYGAFVRGGFWRNFLSKYPESNNIHKKMLWVDEKIKRASSNSITGKQKALLDRATDEKRKGQCNDSYWHGVFGGLYLNHLRTAIYEHLITAETLIDQATHQNSNWIDVEKMDFDRDGNEELLVETPQMNISISPSRGGSIFEIDCKAIAFNFLNTMARREEPYHRKILEKLTLKPSDDSTASIHDLVLTKEEGLERLLNYDWYRRTFLIDHFLRADTTLDSFAACDYAEQGDFIDKPFELKSRKNENEVKIILWRHGQVWAGERWCSVHLKKEIIVPNNKASFAVRYTIINNHPSEIPIWFGTECNLSMLDGESDDRYYIIEGREISPRKLSSKHYLNDITGFGVEDRYLKVKCEFRLSETADLWLFPIHTVSLSEAGFEKVYQSSVLMPQWKSVLSPGDCMKFDLSFTISAL